MVNVTKVSISIPKALLNRVERERGDVPRSVFIYRLVEKGLEKDGTEEKEGK